MRREIQSSGKGRATVNGALVPVGVLRELAPFIANIHGQHEPQGLLDPETHLDLLDHHAGLDSDEAAMAEPLPPRCARSRPRSSRSAATAARRERRREMLEYQAVGDRRRDARRPARKRRCARRSGCRPTPAAWPSSRARPTAPLRGRGGRAQRGWGTSTGRSRSWLAHRSALRTLCRGARRRPGAARRSRPLPARLSRVLQVSPGRLDEIETRLALIDRLKRKYGATVEDVIAFGEKSRCRSCATSARPEERRARAGQEREAPRRPLPRPRPSSSRAQRRTAARDLEKKVRRELALLAMERTRFKVAFSPDSPAGSADDASALDGARAGDGRVPALPNPGEELRPLARIASGGELSRILLALKSVASLDARGKTLVFDEVDAGIGGRVAEVVGRKLRDMARHHQVLCVTHLPQIASMADRHLRGAQAASSAGARPPRSACSTPSERVEEVARMLGGETVTDAARRHAREMVKQARRVTTAKNNRSAWVS